MVSIDSVAGKFQPKVTVNGTSKMTYHFIDSSVSVFPRFVQ